MRDRRGVTFSFSGRGSSQINLDSLKRGRLDFRLEGLREGDDLTLDLYPVENPRHPDRHYGYWVFQRLSGGSYLLIFDLAGFNRESLVLMEEGTPVPPVHVWMNDEAELEPVVDFQVVVRRKGKIASLTHFNLQLKAQADIEKFYQQGGGGVYPVDPFNLQFHHARLRLLSMIFRRRLEPGMRVLDAASGRGIFYLLQNPFRARVFCLDLHFQDFRPEQGLYGLFYLRGSLQALPFRPETFDLVFAGEAVEHLSDPEAVLVEFHKLLRPGGILVLTTPNSRRLINRVRGFPLPLSREHINERSLGEWARALEKSGFRLLSKKGIYLELILSFWRGQRVEDFVRSRGHKRWARPVIRCLMSLGSLFPASALDLVLTGQKK